jgi:predicted ribosomally synthesized peptide with nif11-like leader
MPINKNEITKEMLEKAMQCKTADELIALAKTGGCELTKEEAEAYLAELADVELDEEKLKQVAGGVCWTNCPKENECPGHVCGMVGWTNFKGC